MELSEMTFKGTTTVGLVCKDGVVLATDKRATVGYMVASKEARKIYKVDDHIGVTIAGVVGDAQSMTNLMGIHAKLYKVRVGRPIPVKSMVNLASTVLHSWRLFPLVTNLVVGGVDDNPRMFSLDIFGGITEDKLIATGSGSPYALGVLESEYSENIDIDKGVEVAVKAVWAAMQRDTASGNGISLASVDFEKGFREYSPREVEEILNKIRG